MIIDESGWFASLEKSVSVIILLCLWHNEPKWIKNKLPSESSSTNNSSNNDIFITDSPEDLVNTFNIWSDCFHFLLWSIDRLLKNYNFHESLLLTLYLIRNTMINHLLIQIFNDLNFNCLEINFSVHLVYQSVNL